MNNSIIIIINIMLFYHVVVTFGYDKIGPHVMSCHFLKEK